MRDILSKSMRFAHWQVVCAGLLLVAIICGLYGQVLGFSLVEYDDTVLLAENPYVRHGLTTEGLKWAFYFHDGGQSLRAGVENLWHPLTWVSHMVDYELWGANYSWHHAMNLALHALATLLVFWVFSRWLGSRLGGFMMALLFAIHPMHVETVAWLSDRKGLLSACGFLLSLGLYQRSEGSAQSGRQASAWVFGLALLAKPSVVVLPGILVLLDWYENRKGVPDTPRDWLVFHIRDKALWWVPALLVSGVTLLSQGGGTHGDVGPMSARVLALPANFLDYWIKLLWPVGLTFHNAAPVHATSWVYGSLLGCGFLVLFSYLWSQRERQHVALVSGLWMLLCWLPVSGWVVVGTSFTCNRYSYLMYCGAFFGIVSAWLHLFARQRVLASGVAVAGLSALAVLAFQQVNVWKTSEALFAHAYRWQPHDFNVVINQATMKQRMGKVEESLKYYEQARQLAPRDPVVLFNIAVVEANRGNFTIAAKHCREAVANQPAFAPAWFHLGRMISQGNAVASYPDEARVCLERACEASCWKNPKSILALAQVYQSSGQSHELRGLVERTRELKISDPRLASMMDQWRQKFP